MPKRVKKLQPSWSNAPKIEDFEKDLNNANVSHAQHTADVAGWVNLRNVTGKEKIKKQPNRSAVTPKMVRKHNEWRYSNLTEPFHTAPTLFSPRVVGPDDRELKDETFTILNQQFDDPNVIDKVAFIDRGIRRGVDEGSCILKAGWAHETRKEMQQVPVVRDGVVVGAVDREVTVVVKNHPTVDVLKPDSLIIDPNAEGDIRKAQFLIEPFPTSIAALTAAGSYSNLAALKEQVTASNKPETRNSATHKMSTRMEYSDDARKEFTAYRYWGYWDITGKNLLEPIVAVFAGNVILKLEHNPYPDKSYPFELIQYMPVLDENYGEPDAELIGDNQRIVGALTRGAVDLMGRSANSQKAVSSTGIDLVQRRRMERGEDFYVQGDMDPAKVAHMYTYPEIPNSVGAMIGSLQADAESTSGVKTYGEGINGGSLGDSVGNANKSITASAKRESGIIRRFSKGFAAIGGKIAQMNALYLSDAEVERITGKPKVQSQDEVLAKDIVVKVRTQDQDTATAESLAFMLQTVGNAELNPFTQVALGEIMKLRGEYDLAEMIQSFQPPPPTEEEQAMQELQQQLGMAELEEKLAKAEELKTKAKLNQAKADREYLEYVEEESGVNHERDKEKMTIQAEGNFKLRALEGQIDAINAPDKPTEGGKK